MEWQDSIDSDAIEVKVAELLVATADEADYLVDGSVQEVLALLRERMRMDVVFVSEFRAGERVFRAVDHAAGAEVIAEGGADPVEASWCQRVVDGRLAEFVPDAAQLQARGELPATPFPIGTHLSTPIRLSDGSIYGTLCCFSFGVSPGITEQDLKRLRYTATLTARKIERAKQRVKELELQRIPERGFKGRL